MFFAYQEGVWKLGASWWPYHTTTEPPARAILWADRDPVTRVTRKTAIFVGSAHFRLRAFLERTYRGDGFAGAGKSPQSVQGWHLLADQLRACAALSPSAAFSLLAESTPLVLIHRRLLFRRLLKPLCKHTLGPSLSPTSGPLGV